MLLLKSATRGNDSPFTKNKTCPSPANTFVNQFRTRSFWSARSNYKNNCSLSPQFLPTNEIITTPYFSPTFRTGCLSIWRCFISDHTSDTRGSGNNRYLHHEAPESQCCVSHLFSSLLYHQDDFLEHCLWEDCLKQCHSLRRTHLLVTCRGELNFSVLGTKKLRKLFSCWVKDRQKAELKHFKRELKTCYTLLLNINSIKNMFSTKLT